MTRSKLDIFAQILEVAKSGKTKTAIVSQVNLNQQLATSTLKLLLDLDLVSEKRNSPTAYLTSERGLRFLREYQYLRQILESK
jgi:predicted transcriptional regulator